MVYKVGPERYSFDRLEREYGSGDASCKAAFRFHLRDLRALYAAMHFPDRIDTGEEKVPSEEAFLILLKRLAYPTTLATLAWPAGRSPYALSRHAAYAGCRWHAHWLQDVLTCVRFRVRHRIFNATVRHVYTAFDHLRDARSLEAWGAHFKLFAKTIRRGGKRSRRSRRGSPMPLHNCIGFIDGSNQY